MPAIARAFFLRPRCVKSRWRATSSGGAVMNRAAAFDGRRSMVLQPYQGHLAFDRKGTPLWRCGIWPAKGLALEAVARQLGFTIEQVTLQGYYEALVTVGGRVT